MLIGNTLKGRYRIYDRLGAGGSANVYLARDSRTGQMVIVKVVHDTLIDEDFMRRFEREIEILEQIDNPYVVKLYDWALKEFDPESNLTLSYIVAEFIEGHTLADIIDTRGELPEADSLAITRQLAGALVDIHTSGIVHRDIKSQNIMLTPDNLPKLIDFGIAKASHQSNITGAAIFAGTVYYAAPEQIMAARDVDQRADIYSLGVVLYEMLSANLPVRARELGAAASRIVSGQLDPLVGVSKPVEELVMQMLARVPADRIQAANDVIKRIDDIIGKQPQEAHLPDRPSPRTTTINMKTPRKTEPETPIPASCHLRLDSGKVVPLTQSEMTIGRSHPRDTFIPDIDLDALGAVDSRTASRRHCRIFEIEGEYFIEDLGSMNGTGLNGTWLEASRAYPLPPGAQITVGRVQITFEKK